MTAIATAATQTAQAASLLIGPPHLVERRTPRAPLDQFLSRSPWPVSHPGQNKQKREERAEPSQSELAEVEKPAENRGLLAFRSHFNSNPIHAHHTRARRAPDRSTPRRCRPDSDRHH